MRAEVKRRVIWWLPPVLKVNDTFFTEAVYWSNCIPLWFINVSCPWTIFVGFKPVWALSVIFMFHFVCVCVCEWVSEWVDKAVLLPFGDVSIGRTQSKTRHRWVIWCV
jgi:hypothetical protein